MARKPIIASAVMSLASAVLLSPVSVEVLVKSSSLILTRLKEKTSKSSLDITQQSYIKGWLSKTLLEEWRGELEALRYSWLKEGKHEVWIKIMTGFCLLGLVKAYLQIKVENIWLPKKKQS